MNPALKYTLARIGIFVVSLAFALLLLPRDLNLLLKLLVALVLSTVASYFLLRPWADELGERMAARSQRRGEEKERLRAALAGEDEPPPPSSPAEGDRPA